MHTLEFAGRGGDGGRKESERQTETERENSKTSFYFTTV